MDGDNRESKGQLYAQRMGYPVFPPQTTGYPNMSQSYPGPDYSSQTNPPYNPHQGPPYPGNDFQSNSYPPPTNYPPSGYPPPTGYPQPPSYPPQSDYPPQSSYPNQPSYPGPPYPNYPGNQPPNVVVAPPIILQGVQNPPPPQVVESPPQVIVNPGNPTIVVTNPNLCPSCRVGVLTAKFTVCGIICAIIFFPLGFICCCLMTKKRCTNCGSVF